MSSKVMPPSEMIIVAGKEKKWADPFVGPFEVGFISPTIIYNSHSYRLLGIYSGRADNLAAIHFHKFHIFDEEGKVVENEEIALYCLQVYLTFYTVMISEKEIEYAFAYEKDEYGEANLVDIKETMEEGYLKEHGKLSKLFGDLDQMLVYLKEVEEPEKKMNEYASELTVLMDEVRDTLKVEEATFKSLLFATSQFKKCARRKGILLMQNQDKLRMVRTLLQNDVTNKYFDTFQKGTAKKIIDKISDEIDYQQVVYTSHDTLFVTPKSYIKKLQEIPDDYIRMQAEQFLRKKWIVVKKPSFLSRFQKSKVK
ncbi:hypothetical protein ACFFF5_10770 [Lederbergia wuyishanensis]|uniref:Uncharacterized protein n=1 Tax=Lederbergia wuyishanensis TaxID=1347903 RepID=A0ABU0D6R9_9BACI|nr:hypothetical protein [Lederbergia wuyishanensis]MCJ8008762.1 hypothetical protein [Lederbergia wuyishanensis]MDQ0344082.1 hypothetical protein [Lederbergia wuyishanensis]